MLAGLPYVVWPIGSAFILASRKKEDPFLYYHAIQALLAGAVMAAGVVILLVGLFLYFRIMPGAASYAPAVISLGALFGGIGLALAILLTAIFLGWRATEGEMLKLPFIGEYAEERMVDESGMTRRQFVEMMERSVKSPQELEEEIPFPEPAPGKVIATAPAPKPMSAIDRLEAARKAREEAARAQQEQTQASQPPEPPRPSSPQPSPGAQRPQPPRTRERQASQPVVKELDLIGHYKEKKVETTGAQGGKNANVLRQWLSSVEQEGG